MAAPTSRLCPAEANSNRYEEAYLHQDAHPASNSTCRSTIEPEADTPRSRGLDSYSSRAHGDERAPHGRTISMRPASDGIAMRKRLTKERLDIGPRSVSAVFRVFVHKRPASWRRESTTVGLSSLPDHHQLSSPATQGVRRSHQVHLRRCKNTRIFDPSLFGMRAPPGTPCVVVCGRASKNLYVSQPHSPKVEGTVIWKTRIAAPGAF